MKKMKKLLAGLMAATMVMSMSVTAFAASSNYGKTDKFEDESTVTFTKVYKATGENPEETFSFTVIEGWKTTDADGNEVTKNIEENDEASYPATLPSITDVKYSKGEATEKGTEKDLTITLPTYEKVGVYYYTITENVPETETAGVEYWEKPIMLKVTVIQDSEGRIRVAAVHCEEGADGTAEEQTKTDEIINTYTAGNLTVEKIVTGNMGDQDAYFEVTVSFMAEEGTEVTSDITITGGSHDDNPEKISGAESAWTTKEVKIYLKHGDTVEFANIPAGVSYTVVETDYTETDGYDDAKYSVDSSTETTTTVSDKIKVENEDKSIDDAVVITNNKGVTVDTGISLDNMPYIMVLAMVALGLVGFVSKKRSMEF